MNFRQPFWGGYPITLGFGEAAEGLYKSGEHKGIDFGCPMGTPILAAADGVVAVRDYQPEGYGHYVVVRHADGSGTVYAHLSAPLVISGSAVRQGERIGLSGRSGNSTGAHLHFEARAQFDRPGSAFDPRAVMQTLVTPEVKPEETPPVKQTVHAGKAHIVCDCGANVRNAALQCIDVLGKGREVVVTDERLYFSGLPYRVCLLPVYIAEFDAHGTQILQNIESSGVTAGQ